MINIICKCIASVFYIGYLPIAPGTLGSLSGLLVYYFINKDTVLTGIFILVSIFLGLLTAGVVERIFKEKDPGEIIIDELAGMLISVYLLPVTMGYMVSAFIIFRFFDIVKPHPIDKLEKLGGGFGIMADDVVAGIYTNLILQAVHLCQYWCHAPNA